MSRRTLWGGVAAVCLAIVAAGRPEARAWVVAQLAGLGTAPLGVEWPLWLAAAATAALTVILAARWLARRDDRGGWVRRLARGGAPVVAIARRTGLAQDAVRDLLGAAGPAGPARVTGRNFRRPQPGSFAEVLAATD